MTFGEALKQCRKEAKKSVKEVSAHLIGKGFKAAENTIYSWENDKSQPTPDAFLELCRFYGVQDIYSVFGYEGENKKPATNDDELLDRNVYSLLKRIPKEKLDEAVRYLLFLASDSGNTKT